MGDRRSAAPLGGRLGAGGQRAAKISQATLESFGEVGIDGWLPVGVAARWLGSRLFGFVDAEPGTAAGAGPSVHQAVGCP
jgi:hypothetical protein